MAQPAAGQRPSLGSPPELPSIPDMNPRLGDYLRRFSLWSLGNFNSCLQKRSATGELYLQSKSGQTVWAVTIDDSGVLHTTQLIPGKGPS